MIELIPQTININTNRCTIKNIKEEDINDISILYQDKETRKYLGGTIPKEEAIIKINEIINNKENVYTIRDKNNKDFIGLLYLAKYYDEVNIELSYELLSNKYRQGYATECLLQILNYLKEIGIKKVVAETQKKNKNSIKLLEKLGYKKIKELKRFNEEQIVFEKKLK